MAGLHIPRFAPVARPSRVATLIIRGVGVAVASTSIGIVASPAAGAAASADAFCAATATAGRDLTAAQTDPTQMHVLANELRRAAKVNGVPIRVRKALISMAAYHDAVYRARSDAERAAVSDKGLAKYGKVAFVFVEYYTTTCQQDLFPPPKS